MIIKHRLLVCDHPAPKAFTDSIPAEWDIRHQIDHSWYHHKKQDTESQRLPHIFLEHLHNMAMGNASCLTPRIIPGDLELHIPLKQDSEEKYSESSSRIHRGPLASTAKSHHQPTQSKGNQGLFEIRIIKACLGIAVHKVKHRYDKKGSIDVDGGDSRLGKMHKIERKQRRHHACHPSSAKQSLSKQIDKRNHTNTKEGSYNSPSKGIHAKCPHTQRDENLAERRMGIFIGAELMDHLIRSSGMIYLIKIRSTAESELWIKLILFIKQLRILGSIFWHNVFPGSILKYQLIEHRLIVKQRHTQITGIHLERLGLCLLCFSDKPHIVPLKHIPGTHGSRCCVVRTVVGHLHLETAPLIRSRKGI